MDIEYRWVRENEFRGENLDDQDRIFLLDDENRV
jgi:hypothetical protein